MVVEAAQAVVREQGAAGNVLVLVNPTAGKVSVDDVRATLGAAFDPIPRPWSLLELQGPAQDLTPVIADAVEAGCSTVVAAGGDGTVSVVADAIVRANLGDRAPALGILPLGTANVLARELRVPLDVREAALLVASGHRRRAIDAMALGKRHYFTQIGIGLDAEMIAQTSRQSQQQLGRLAYLIAFVRSAFGHRSHTFRVSVDGRTMQLRAWATVIANGRTLGAPPLVWGPDVDPSDGEIDLCVYSVRTIGDYLRLVWTVIARRHVQDPNYRTFTARRSVTIACARPLAVQADGESVGDTPIEVRVVPAAVQVLVPPEAAVEPGLAPRRRHMARIAWRRRWDVNVAALGHFDAAAFLWVNRLPRRRWLDWAMVVISRTMPHGEGWLAFLLAAMLLDWERGWRAARVVVPAMWLASLTVNYPIKALFRRSRPFAAEHGDVVVLGSRPSDPSFPSGHTAAAFAGAWLLSRYWPELAPVCYAIAGVVGLSRIWLGVHFPFDVVVGAITGVLLAAAYAAAITALFPGLAP